jgi:FkbM family methyltransferase
MTMPRGTRGEALIDGYSVEYLDPLSLYMQYKDIFAARIYHFESSAPNPRVIDGGAFIGMSVLYTKKTHPGARITCFEPDPHAHAVLRRNVEANTLGDVELVEAALAREAGSESFHPDGRDGGRLVESEEDLRVATVPLSSYLDEQIDFLKLNIEGMELPVLEEAADVLSNVRELVLEYHGWPREPQRLGPILSLLDDCGFRYLINLFDDETNDALNPPFRLRTATTWFALVYGRRKDLI